MPLPQKISPTNACRIFSASLCLDAYFLIFKPFSMLRITAELLQHLYIVATVSLVLAIGTTVILKKFSQHRPFLFTRKHIAVALGSIALAEALIILLQSSAMAAPVGFIGLSAVFFLSKITSLNHRGGNELRPQTIFFIGLFATRVLLFLCSMLLAVTNGESETAITGVAIGFLFFIEFFQLSKNFSAH